MSPSVLKVPPPGLVLMGFSNGQEHGRAFWRVRSWDAEQSFGGGFIQLHKVAVAQHVRDIFLAPQNWIAYRICMETALIVQCLKDRLSSIELEDSQRKGVNRRTERIVLGSDGTAYFTPDH